MAAETCRGWRFLVVVSGVLVEAAALVTLAAAVGRARLEARFRREVADLLGTTRDARPAVLTEADVAGLPEPVRRWLRYARVVGRERPVRVRVRQVGEFRMGPHRGWMPFQAEQHYTMDPPGYMWVATFRMAPLVTIFGRDRYARGTGNIDMWLLNLIPVARKSGGGLDQGALLRYLNELMWFPAAASSPLITWTAVDADSARATIAHAGTTASATFFFDAEGRLVDMKADRYNDARDRVLPWSTPVTGYGEFEGVRIPVEGRGVWRYEDGDFTYIRLRITDLAYNRSLPDRTPR